MKPLGNGFYAITETHAKQLCPKLPKFGTETLVHQDNQHYWLQQVSENNKKIWTIRNAGNWTIVNGKAVLKGK